MLLTRSVLYTLPLSFQMCRAAQIYGYFVPAKAWVPLVSQRLLSEAVFTDLMVVSHVISGSDSLQLRNNLEDLTLTLQDDSVCLTSNVRSFPVLHGILHAWRGSLWENYIKRSKILVFASMTVVNFAVLTEP